MNFRICPFHQIITPSNFGNAKSFFYATNIFEPDSTPTEHLENMHFSQNAQNVVSGARGRLFLCLTSIIGKLLKDEIHHGNV